MRLASGIRHLRTGVERHTQWARCEIEPLLVASMATTLLEGLVSSALAGNELFESFFRAAGLCLLVEAWRDAGAPRAFDGTALPGWSPNAGHLLATRSPSMKNVSRSSRNHRYRTVLVEWCMCAPRGVKDGVSACILGRLSVYLFCLCV